VIRDREFEGLKYFVALDYLKISWRGSVVELKQDYKNLENVRGKYCFITCFVSVIQPKHKERKTE